MKRNDIQDIQEQIFLQNYENLFNVYATTNGDYFYNILRKVNIPEEISGDFFTWYDVSEGDTWTLLAHRFFGDVKLWWIICLANHVYNPLEFPKAGSRLKIFTNNVTQNILMDLGSE